MWLTSDWCAMQKPPCPKCSSINTYLEVPRFSPENCFIGCYVCGWRLYGETAIRSYVESFTAEAEIAQERARIEEAERLAKEAAAEERKEEERRRALKRERDRRYRERKRLAKQQAAEGKKESNVYVITSLGTSFRVGELDAVLRLPWAEPLPNLAGENLDPCAWPPCENRSRPNSKYCSRKCTVRVAHRRDKLRKKGELQERIAS